MLKKHRFHRVARVPAQRLPERAIACSTTDQIDGSITLRSRGNAMEPMSATETNRRLHRAARVPCAAPARARDPRLNRARARPAHASGGSECLEQIRDAFAKKRLIHQRSTRPIHMPPAANRVRPGSLRGACARCGCAWIARPLCYPAGLVSPARPGPASSAKAGRPIGHPSAQVAPSAQSSPGHNSGTTWAD